MYKKILLVVSLYYHKQWKTYYINSYLIAIILKKSSWSSELERLHRFANYTLFSAIKRMTKGWPLYSISTFSYIDLPLDRTIRNPILEYEL